jgi:glycosyltransferase involved in cell wall biosynthesis
MTDSDIPKKKLLMVLHSLSGGGAERVAIHLINHLNKDAYHIHLALFEDTLDYPEYLDSALEKTCLHKKSRLDFLKLIFRLRRLIRELKPDVVFSLLTYENFVSVLARLFLRQKYTLIISEHLYTEKYLREVRLGNVKRHLIKLLYRRADKIVTVSNAISESLIEDFSVPRNKVITIYNPIPVDEIREKSREEVQHEFFDHNNQVLIGVGRLDRQKRFDRLLRVFSQLRKERDNLYMIILGKGALIHQLKELASSLDVADYVDFAGFQSNPFTWISRSDIFVLSSDYEGFPMVLLECMACGTPIVSTDCPSGPAELITHGKSGLLVPPEDEDALVREISTLLDDHELRDEFVREGRKTAVEYKTERIIEQYEKLFSDLT